jgi:hypothetical protein
MSDEELGRTWTMTVLSLVISALSRLKLVSSLASLTVSPMRKLRMPISSTLSSPSEWRGADLGVEYLEEPST